MARIRPFRALRYDADRVKLSDVIVPPYDVIAHDERESFYERDPHNAIRLELTRDVADEAGTDYSDVADTLSAWRSEKVLVREDAPTFYVMRQRFTAPDGQALERIGFFAALGLEDYSDRVVRPHERTLAGPKADRLKILRAARANLSSVFLLYEDRDQKLAALLGAAFEGGRVESAKDDSGVEYELALIQAPAVIAEIESFLEDRPLVIADGHHRYETALAYRDEQRCASGAAKPDENAPFESTLVYVANAYAPGSLLLPIHRVVREGPAPSLEEWQQRLPGWRYKDIPVSGVDGIAALLEEHLAPLDAHPAFAADDASGDVRIWWREEALGDELMVRRLEVDVLGAVFGLDGDAIRGGAVSFPKSAPRAAQEVREGQGAVALYLNALHPDDVFRVTGEGEVMPQKSTFFYPKVPTGLVFRSHDEDGA